MTAVLLICEIGLFSWLAWNLQICSRPFFCLLILAMTSATAVYRVETPAANFVHSQTVQTICMALAVLEGVWLQAGRQKLLATLYCAVFGLLVVVAEKGLDERYGWFNTAITLAVSYVAGMAVGAVTILWNRHSAWLAILSTVKPIAGLTYWFIGDNWEPWLKVNAVVMGTLALLPILWILWVPIRTEFQELDGLVATE